MADIAVKESQRLVHFNNGQRIRFNNVTTINNEGTFLRLICDEGYVLINNDNILYMSVPKEARVA